MEKYNQYSREQLIQKIELLKSENKGLIMENSFLKEYIRGTKEFKELNKWIKDSFGE